MMESGTPSDDFNKVEEGFHPDKRIEVTFLKIPIDAKENAMKFDTKTITGLILGALSVFPTLIQAIGIFKSGSTATADQKAEAITGLAGASVAAVSSVSTGGQADTMAKAASLLPDFHTITTSLMNLAESTGKTGVEKQGFVSSIVQTIVSDWEKLSTGGQATTVQDIKPVVDAAIDTLVPVIFSKDSIAGLEASKG